MQEEKEGSKKKKLPKWKKEETEKVQKAKEGKFLYYILFASTFFYG